MKGFTFFLKGKDYFVVTDKVNKTENLVKEILRAIDCPTNSENVLAMLCCLEKAECEYQTINGETWYNIYGKNFGGRGSKVNDGNTVIITLEKNRNTNAGEAKPDWIGYADRVIASNGNPSTRDASECKIPFEAWLRASNLSRDAYINWAREVKEKYHE